MRFISDSVKNSKITKVVTVLLLALIIAGGMCFKIKEKYDNQALETMKFHETLEDRLLRFHVRANSDTKEDQKLKLAIKDRIIKYITPAMKKCNTKEESQKVIKQNINNIKAIAEDEIQRWGKDYSVKIYLGKSKFPVKKYGDLVFPAGTYDAVQVVLGKGKGHNWWCVMFPPLCLTDVTNGTVPYNSKKKIEKVIGSKYYVIIDQGKSGKGKKIIGRFKLIELFEEGSRTISHWLNGK